VPKTRVTAKELGRLTPLQRKKLSDTGSLLLRASEGLPLTTAEAQFCRRILETFLRK
jgi:hypothetical protein